VGREYDGERDAGPPQDAELFIDGAACTYLLLGSFFFHSLLVLIIIFFFK
jgi:hypothetical protein